MRPLGFFLLLLLAGAASTGVFYLVLAEEAQPAATSGGNQLLFQEFGLAANSVAEIQLVTGAETLTVSQTEGAWSLQESGGYAVKLNLVKKLVLSVAELRVEEKKTAKAENHSRLGLEAPEAADSTSKRLTFKDASGKNLASLIIGNSKYRAGSQGLFVRRDGEDQTWLCTGRIELPYSAKNWMETKILELEKQRVSSLRILHTDGEELNITPSAETPGDFDLSDVPLGRTLTAPGNATAAASALSSLHFDDVQPVDSIDFAAEPVAQSTYFCKDGLVLVITSARQSDQTWIKITATQGEPSEAPAAEEADAAKAKLEAEIAELNGRLAAWAYSLPSYKSDLIAKPLEDLLKSLDGPDTNSTPSFEIGPDGGLPPELQKLLDSQKAGPPIPRTLPTEETPSAESIEEAMLEEPVLMDSETESPPVVKDAGAASDDQ